MHREVRLYGPDRMDTVQAFGLELGLVAIIWICKPAEPTHRQHREFLAQLVPAIIPPDGDCLC